MTVAGACETVGCLYIDDMSLGARGSDLPSRAPDIPGVAMRPFRCSDARMLWDGLQIALQRLRKEWGTCSAMAVGGGCAPALALASQLPVERLVLVNPALPERRFRLRDCAGGGEANAEEARLRRTLRRLTAFARRNLSLCVSDMLLIDNGAEDGGRCAWRGFGKPQNCRVRRLVYDGDCAKDLYTIREFAMKEAISCFLRAGEVPKPLAQNSEMCIIYG